MYGLDLDDLGTGRLRVLDCADLVANLPPGSMTWIRMGAPMSWTPMDYLLAVQVDQMNLWMWANSDPKKRGPRPTPIPRPGVDAKTGRADEDDGESTKTRRIRPQPMTRDELDAFMGQRFEETGSRQDRPMAGE